MLFNTVEFLLFFPITVFVFYLIPVRFRNFWLLVASYYFYMRWNPRHVLLLLGCTAITYAGGIFIERIRTKATGRTEIFKTKLCLGLCLIINLGILILYKYMGFGLNLINRLLSALHVPFAVPIDWVNNIILPVGISFYILQSLGYLIDVYRKEINAENNFFRYALFVSFFPQLVAGPIERSKNLLAQLTVPKRVTGNNIKSGIIIMLWGFFLKLVIADRIAIFVNKVYENSSCYVGFYIVLATMMFALQIYCDFYGYSTIARGAALFFGIRLMDNFNAPYFSKSIAEFWRRWHISLSGWFKDYLYIPLGGSQKGILRKQLNKMIVFFISGLWHGASLSYIIWGGLNGIYQVISDMRNYFINKDVRLYGRKTNPRIKIECASKKILQCSITFIMVCFAWFFFRAGSMSNAVMIMKQVPSFNWEIFFNGAIYNLGISKDYFRVLILAIGVLAYVDYKKYQNKDVVEIIMKQDWWFQGIIVLALLYGTLLFGCYGAEYDTNQFIYFQF